MATDILSPRRRGFDIFVLTRTLSPGEASQVVLVDHHLSLSQAIATAEAWCRRHEGVPCVEAEVWLNAEQLVYSTGEAIFSAKPGIPSAPGRYRWQDSDDSWRLVTKEVNERGLGQRPRRGSGATGAGDGA